MLALKNSRVNFKKLFNKKRNDIPLILKGKVQQMKKITYYNTDLEKYVEIEVPININIVTESERFDTQKMLAIAYEKSKIKNKQEELISNIYDSYLDSVIYDTYSTLPFNIKGTLPFIDECLENDVFDECLENDVYNIYNAFEVSSFYSNV
jgi:hypothetical protein